MKDILFTYEGAEGEPDDEARPTDAKWREALKLAVDHLFADDATSHDKCEYHFVLHSPARAEEIKQEEVLKHAPFGHWGWHEPGFGYGEYIFIDEDGNLQGEDYGYGPIEREDPWP